MPAEAGGVFVSGGTAGNLSALVAARWKWRHDAGGAHDRTRGLLVASTGAHSSVAQAARVMDADVIGVAADERGRMHGDALRAVVDSLDARRSRPACSRSSPLPARPTPGSIDDLAGTADVCADMGVWIHVDGAYGGAGLAAPSVRDRFAGIEHADSFIVDPHKWLFAPFDSCALIYRDPSVARAAHTQHAEYLDVLQEDATLRDVAEGDVGEEGAPQDHAGTRPTSPTTSLAAPAGCRCGSAWRRTAPTRTRAPSSRRSRSPVRRAAEIAATPHTELIMEPELSVVLFRRRGWTSDQYEAWSDRELAEGRSFVTSTSWGGETVLRICIVNPVTTLDDIRVVIDSLVD